MHKNKHNKGFTLIELLVVIAIISLLSSIVLASLKSAKDKAGIAKMQQEVRQFKQAMESYRSEKNAYPQIGTPSTDLNDLNDGDYPGGVVFRAALLPYMDINKITITKTPNSFITPPNYFNYTCQGEIPLSGGYVFTFSNPNITKEFKKWYKPDGTWYTGVYCFMND